MLSAMHTVAVSTAQDMIVIHPSAIIFYKRFGHWITKSFWQNVLKVKDTGVHDRKDKVALAFLNKT